MNILIEELPEYEVAFFRHVGSYFEPNGEHWGKLLNWAINNGLLPPQQSFIGISLDNPDLVEGHNCRHDACVTIPDGFDKEIHKNMRFRKLDGGKYALYQYYGTPGMLNIGYKCMYEEWLPNSDYEPDYDRHNLEFSMNNPAEDPEGKSKVHLYVPVKKRIS
ncbi:GyrI-like domain-containing protein [Neobacillus sp. DY30]|uniref:AraC family transcriptional regulator n=1 Tax=Neobacillus sp. DY30 TaxID=3047871 RepID=UPI0024BF4881|nr:GyrI-like domain-containing protein [Neobacillus sp. DY30]WHX98056.1 GyrI-like domain-containing protein [Neobacillus sp. DY30]